MCYTFADFLSVSPVLSYASSHTSSLVGIFSWLFSLALMIFFAGSLLFENGYRYGAYASIILALGFHGFSVYEQTPRLLPITKPVLIVALTLTGYFMVACGLSLFHGETMIEIDQPSRYILSAIILLAICKLRLNPTYVWAGILISAAGTGVFALIQIFHLKLERAEGYLNPIFFGEVAMLLGFLSLVSLTVFQEKMVRLMISFAIASAFLATLLSGTRGGWIALPFLLLIYIGFNTHIRRQIIIIGIITILTVLALLYCIPQTGIALRIDNAIAEYHQSFSAISYKSAIGHRIELWKAALSLIADKPVFGWGEIGLVTQKNTMIDQGLLSETIRPYTHLHSVYLDRWARYGLVGLTTLLLIFLVPLAYFLKHIHLPQCRSYCLAGVLLVTAYMIFSLTDVLLDSEIGLLTYNLLSITLISLTNANTSLDKFKHNGS